ncbi:hypothetical protein [Nocardia farcinica]|uniref:hypothetical protein n=1 Tax=Nocardia farcinica TaxID=37329 RepID=UPI002455BC4F|nr:hypothetical protein [Nocardia farcinica]
MTTGDRPAAAFAPPPKSALVRVELGADRLPTRIELSRNWKNAFEPPEYGRSIMDAYEYALYEYAAHLVATNSRPRKVRPDLREAAPLLLQQRTYEDYNATYARIYGVATYTMHGPDLTEYDEPTLTVRATAHRLQSVTMDFAWAARTESNVIAQDILDCCDKVRAAVPRFVHDVYLDRESNEQLMARLVRHEHHLLRNEI